VPTLTPAPPQWGDGLTDVRDRAVTTLPPHLADGLVAWWVPSLPADDTADTPAIVTTSPH